MGSFISSPKPKPKPNPKKYVTSNEKKSKIIQVKIPEGNTTPINELINKEFTANELDGLINYFNEEPSEKYNNINFLCELKNKVMESLTESNKKDTNFKEKSRSINLILDKKIYILLKPLVLSASDIFIENLFTDNFSYSQIEAINNRNQRLQKKQNLKNAQNKILQIMKDTPLASLSGLYINDIFKKTKAFPIYYSIIGYNYCDNKLLKNLRMLFTVTSHITSPYQPIKSDYITENMSNKSNFDIIINYMIKTEYSPNIKNSIFYENSDLYKNFKYINGEKSCVNKQ